MGEISPQRAKRKKTRLVNRWGKIPLAKVGGVLLEMWGSLNKKIYAVVLSLFLY